MNDPIDAMTQAMTPKRAISYIRVSTRDQASRGGATEGFSIPAQREANKKKAASIGALIVKEFVDRGESARSAKRPALQQMLTYIQESGEIDYVIVHKLDRLARNRADDVDINRVLEQAGVRLISTTENIDQTPGGILLHGIMSSIAEFYSRNLANEVVKGMSQKAKNGGTVGRVPLGYLNKQGRDEQGRESRWVELDPERAPLIQLAFSEYATGNWTLASLVEHLTSRGLTTLPTPSRPEHPLDKGKLLAILRNSYYRGIITYQDVQYPGKHPALVDEATWYQVQTTLSQHRSGERQRIHNHHLKTTIRCGQCGGRLIVHNAKARSGELYPYFVCSYRQRNRNKCQFKAVLIAEVEQRIAEIYRHIHISNTERQILEEYLRHALTEIYASQEATICDLRKQQSKLTNERDKLLKAHYADAIPLELLKTEQHRIAKEMAVIDRELQTHTADKKRVEEHLTTALDLLEDCHRLYTHAPDNLKKLLNAVFFEYIAINPQDDDNLSADEHPTAADSSQTDSDALIQAPAQSETSPRRSLTAKPNPPFDQLASATLRRAAKARPKTKTPSVGPEGEVADIHFDNGSCKRLVVELRGFEPLTSSMPWKRATNCAIAPY